MERLFPTRLEIPRYDGWGGRWSATLTAAGGRANLVATTEPIDPSIDPRQYADAQAEPVEREFDDYVELSFEAALVFGGRPGYLRRFEWRSDIGRVRQMQAYYTWNGRAYLMTGTALAEGFEEVEESLNALMAGVTIGPPEA
jgi:hypothetical protein